jgi:hypothetical protein
MYLLHAINSDRQTRLLNVFGRTAMFRESLKKMSGQGVDPTWLLRSEGGVMAMQCNFHIFQLKVFTNN